MNKDLIKQAISRFTHPHIVERKQIMLGLGILAIVVTASASYVFYSNDSKPIPFELEKSKSIEISNIAKGAKAEDRWLNQAEGEIKGLDQRIADENKSRNLLERKLEALERSIASNEEERVAADRRKDEIIESLKANIEDLQAQVLEAESAKLAQTGDFSPQVSRKIQSKEIKLVGSKSGDKTFNLMSYLPAGSFVSAVMISGVDASVAITAQSDPRPVLFRIISKARNVGKKSSDLTGCLVTGAASGDLSSERVFVRLLKMTCDAGDGQVTETDVEGYVSEMGKVGIRGQVISREGDFVAKSFLAGVTSGIGSGVAQRMASPISIPTGLATQRATTGDILGSGLGKGVESSGNSLSDYLIKRAEQYQPVISVAAGLDVELVFQSGVYIDGREVKK